ncbi:hypothetical protein [Dyella amyloliquefaciens]|uniref:hypothetical protein n=1 Tax=Dyella amyloliquefaciens TaxID=1770545 RepID=UPI00102E390B|nr:hypothetical protein [Dyella amyloliquefaciens]
MNITEIFQDHSMSADERKRRLVEILEAIQGQNVSLDSSDRSTIASIVDGLLREGLKEAASEVVGRLVNHDVDSHCPSLINAERWADEGFSGIYGKTLRRVLSERLDSALSSSVSWVPIEMRLNQISECIHYLTELGEWMTTLQRDAVVAVAESCFVHDGVADGMEMASNASLRAASSLARVLASNDPVYAENPFVIERLKRSYESERSYLSRMRERGMERSRQSAMEVHELPDERTQGGEQSKMVAFGIEDMTLAERVAESLGAKQMPEPRWIQNIPELHAAFGRGIELCRVIEEGLQGVNLSEQQRELIFSDMQRALSYVMKRSSH